MIENDASLDGLRNSYEYLLGSRPSSNRQWKKCTVTEIDHLVLNTLKIMLKIYMMCRILSSGQEWSLQQEGPIKWSLPIWSSRRWETALHGPFPGRLVDGPVVGWRKPAFQFRAGTFLQGRRSFMWKMKLKWCLGIACSKSVRLGLGRWLPGFYLRGSPSSEP